MNKAWSRLALCLALSLPPLLRADDVLEVDLGDPQPTATAVAPTPTPGPPTPTAVPTALPTPVPTAVPSVAASPAADSVSGSAGALELNLEGSPQPTAALSPGEDLGKVRFDKPEGSEDGLMIIAPGAASPEDSLESFGIDSPFNWKGRGRKTLKPGEAETEEALELGAPETSDLRERVQVETGEGEALPSDSDYDKIERAGLVLSASEYRVDGRVSRSADGGFFAVRDGQVALRMEPGRQIYPGSIYTVFREVGMLHGTAADAPEAGMLVQNTGVVKVVRIEGEEVLARVVAQYETVREGDLVRLRDPERLRYYSSLRQGGTAPAELKGEVVGMMPPRLAGHVGDVVYLNIGKREGAWPGLRLLLSRGAEEVGTDGIRSVRATGRLGQVEVINVSKDAATARVMKAYGEVRIGDTVRFR